jgi:hypothetical protein
MKYKKIIHEVFMNTINKFFEFISIGIVTPILYIFYSVFVILFTFILGLPIAIGIYLIKLAMELFFGTGGIFYANL